MYDEVEHILADHGRRFDNRGWVLGTSGNLSARLDRGGRFLVTATGRHKGELESGDFVACSLDGSGSTSERPRPSSDVVIHRTLYRHLTGTGAVYHVHPPEAVALTVDRTDDAPLEFSGFSILKAFGLADVGQTAAVPVLADEGDPEATAALIRRHGDDGEWPFEIPAVLARKHGIYAWGESPFAARRHLEALAHLCEARLLTESGRPT